ncbi:MAG: hypothetical protein JWN44_6961 [Myxococcales bacterium]|nr:hypothetical protein [Myxococcales bacterium]
MLAAAGVVAVIWIAPRFGRHEVSPAGPVSLPDRWIAVYGAITHDLTLVRDPMRYRARSPVTRAAACVALPQWALQVGTRDDDQVMLDPKEPAVLLLSHDFLRRVAAGAEPCTAGDSSPVRRFPLHSGKVPYRGIIADGRLLISFFGDNLIEEYTVAPGHDEGAANVMFVRDIHFDAHENLGLSDLMIIGQRLVVAASGFFCFARDCPRGHFHDGHLYSVPLRNVRWPFLDAKPSNVNASGLYRHPSGDVWLLNAGDYSGGYGSIQQIRDVDPPTLDAEVRLPRNAAPGSAYPLDADHFVVLQFSGEHLFVFDARDGRLDKILRFDGAGFSEIARDIAALPDRASSDFQYVLAIPDRAGDAYFVDSKREQLLGVHSEAGKLTVTATIPVGGSGPARRSPSWAFWL